MNQLSIVYGASPVNNQILFSGGHDHHFKNGALRKIMCKNIQPFVLKYGNSIDDHSNDNGPNPKLNSPYNMTNSAWILKYGATNFSPHRMNSVLVEEWNAFNMSVGNIIRESFSKTKIPPLSPPNLTTNTQACTSSIQVSYVAKAE